MKRLPILQTRSCPKVLLLLLVSPSLLLPVANLSAGETPEAVPKANPWSEVVMVDVAPVQRAIALLAPNAQTPPPPAMLDPDQRVQIMAGLAGMENDSAARSAAGSAAETIVLSAARTVVEEKGVLTLVQPYTLHPETGIHMRGSEPGSIGVKVKVDAGDRYLLDFRVKSAVPGIYQLDAEGNNLVIDDALGDREHVLLGLNAGSSGWTTVRLRRPDSDFFLYSVEITRFE